MTGLQHALGANKVVTAEHATSIALDSRRDPCPSGDSAQLRKLKELVAVNYPKADLTLTDRAWRLAHAAHSGQQRASGDPYISHPVAVAEILANMRMDPVTVSAGLLHDVVEDTEVTLDRLRTEFGEEVAFLVDGVTKVSQVHYTQEAQKHLENLRRMIIATARDIRVIIIKLCDRLHNMRTLDYLPPEKQRLIAQATLDIFSPLAHRLGMSAIKNELEDRTLYFLDPAMYQEIKRKLSKRRDDRRDYAERMREILEDVLATHGVVCRVTWRLKHFYSIYMKITQQGRPFEDIFDLTGLRIITNSVSDCYAALGVVHSLYKQVVGRFKDYISNPKPNDYRSIHTTVLGPEGEMLEVQIRTEEMHRVCEEGVAAHWRYKERRSSERRLGDDADWLRQLSGLLEETDDPEELMASLKRDVFSREIFVYTPKGDLMRLPRGATPIDLAYQIHSALGDSCAGARIGNRFVPISYELKTGELVEIVTNKSAHPNSDWLQTAKTSRARTKIRRYLMHANQGKLEEMGRAQLSRELKKIGRSPVQFFNDEAGIHELLKTYSVETISSLLVHIGYGRITTKQILAHTQHLTQEHKRSPAPHKSEKISLAQVDGVLYRRARCCAPVPGEGIIGIVTKGRGITIHRRTCCNVTGFRGEPDRLIDLHWDVGEGPAETHTVQILVRAKDRQRLLADITTMISSTGTNIVATSFESVGEDAKCDFTLQVRDINHLNRLIRQLIEVADVRSVVRRGAGR